jgi:methyltransferase-like protein/SAM-dependent methyltransferase
MATQGEPTNTYDEVPYTTHPVPQSHPDRLATIARLFGMQPQPIDRCRVLELGCGTGANLIPMAERHPQSSFVGIDYSRRAIDSGRQAAESLGLENLKLEHASIADVGPELGTFDYILCHGVYSWVPAEIQEKILTICRSSLAPHGVAIVSYNTNPAWRLRGIVRELAAATSTVGEPPHARVAHMRQAVEFLTTVIAGDSSPYGRLVGTDFDFVLKQADNYLFHEYFEEENQPIYLHEFASQAAAHRLQYLGDSEIHSMFAANLGTKIEQNLMRVSNSVVSIEQHMDLLRNRMFRYTLLCHDNLPLRRHLNLDSLLGLYLAGNLKPTSGSPDLTSSGHETFMTASKSLIGSPSPPVKCALAHLGKIWPRAARLDELILDVEKRLSAAGISQPLSVPDRQRLGDNLVQCLATGMIEARSEVDSFVTAISERPRAGRLAQAQAAIGPSVTTRRHEQVVIDDVSQNTLAQLNGKNDRAALLHMLAEAMDRGRLSIFRDGIPVGRSEVESGILDKALDRCLATLAINALLVA